MRREERFPVYLVWHGLSGLAISYLAAILFTYPHSFFGFGPIGHLVIIGIAGLVALFSGLVHGAFNGMRLYPDKNSTAAFCVLSILMSIGLLWFGSIGMLILILVSIEVFILSMGFDASWDHQTGEKGKRKPREY